MRKQWYLKGKEWYAVIIFPGIIQLSFSTRKKDKKNWLWKLNLFGLLTFFYDYELS